MNNYSEYNFREQIYHQHLQKLSEIRFTFREMDILVCIFHNRNDKRIAQILSISPRTVSTHIYNIMQKLRCNSRDYVIDFIDNSGTLVFVKKYYYCLLIENNFENYLVKIGQINIQNISIKYHSEDLHGKEILLTKLAQHLKIANINLEEEKDKTKDVSSLDIKENEYHHSVLDFIKNLLDKPQINELIKEFSHQYQLILNKIDDADIMKEKAIINYSDHNNILANNLKYYSIRLGLITIFTIFCITTYLIFQSYKSSNVLEERYKEYNSHDIEKAINKMHNSYVNLRKVEELIDLTANQNMSIYFASTELNSNELINYLYTLQALSNYYLYNDHDWKKARKILEHGKKMAEGYIIYTSDLKFKFDQLDNKEIHAKLSVIKDLTEMYTKIIYFLGRTYIYEGNKKEGSKYFLLSKYLGNKVNIFEEHLSKGSLEIIKRIEIEDDIKSKNYKAAIIKLNSSIATYQELKVNDTHYKINYKPNDKNTELINPRRNFYNQVETSEQIIKCYTTLLAIDNNHQQQQIYIEKIKEEIIGNNKLLGIFKCFKELPSKKIAAVINTIGELLLESYDQALDVDHVQLLIVNELKLKKTTNLEIIEQIFNLSNSLSKNTEFTKADSNDGLIRVYTRQIKSNKLKQSEKEALLTKINILKNERDDINVILKRTAQEKT